MGINLWNIIEQLKKINRRLSLCKFLLRLCPGEKKNYSEYKYCHIQTKRNVKEKVFFCTSWIRKSLLICIFYLVEKWNHMLATLAKTSCKAAIATHYLSCGLILRPRLYVAALLSFVMELLLPKEENSHLGHFWQRSDEQSHFESVSGPFLTLYWPL